ncbi:MAG TPA: hypothetical protein VK993_09030 [Chthoniobacterales bacterium]|nr:hypothetical protein [Chthoniobacterales bacterium]
MNNLFPALLIVHIFAGAAALVVAPGAMLTFKGGQWHRRWGLMFFWATIVIAATGTVMSLIRPNFFLLMVAVFSFYLVFSGYRVLHRKKPGQRATPVDQAVTVAMLLCGIAFIGYGAYRLQSSSFGTVPIVFGAIALLLAGGDMVQFRRTPTEDRWWWFTHMRNMLAAYIAVVSAFSVVNLTFLPPVTRWLWPTVVGTTGILLWSRHYRRKFAQQRERSRALAGEQEGKKIAASFRD